MASVSVAEGENEKAPRVYRSSRTISVAVVLLAVAAYLTWAAYTQHGLAAMLADWQFGRFGQILPSFNFVIPIALLLVVALALDALIFHRRRRAVFDTQPAAEIATSSASRFGRLLTIMGTGALALALIFVVWGLALPVLAPNARILPPGAGAPAPAATGAGPVVRGSPDGRLMTTAVQDLLVFSGTGYFIPLIDPAEPKVIRNFVEFFPDERWNGTSLPQVDTSAPMKLYRLPLPRFVSPLYARSGYTVVNPNYVLTTSGKVLQLPYYAGAAQFAIFGILALIAALLQRRHTRRLIQKI